MLDPRSCLIHFKVLVLRSRFGHVCVGESHAINRRPKTKRPLPSRTINNFAAGPGAREPETRGWYRAGQEATVSIVFINCPVFSRRAVTSSFESGLDWSFFSTSSIFVAPPAYVFSFPCSF